MDEVWFMAARAYGRILEKALREREQGNQDAISDELGAM